MNTERELVGRVSSFEHGYFKVVCPDAPREFQVHYLLPWQVRSARIGDRVRLAYRTTPSSGLWVVTEVLR